MGNSLRSIIMWLPFNTIFDTHTIIELLLKTGIYEYLRKGDPLNVYHSRISFDISYYFANEGLVERMEYKSFSKNINNNFNGCTCWRKL